MKQLLNESRNPFQQQAQKRKRLEQHNKQDHVDSDPSLPKYQALEKEYSEMLAANEQLRDQLNKASSELLRAMKAQKKDLKSEITELTAQSKAVQKQNAELKNQYSQRKSFVFAELEKRRSQEADKLRSHRTSFFSVGEQVNELTP